MKLTTREKVLITILLAVSLVWVMNRVDTEKPARSHDVVSLRHLERTYAEYNDEYFGDSLPKDTQFELVDEDGNNMAATSCKNEDGTECRIKFSLKFSSAIRVADFTMLHEQCHIKTWGKDIDSFGQPIEHGRAWRACMLAVDMRGGFREILIDNYREEM